MFSRIWKIQVRSDERPSNRSIPLITPSQVSCDHLLGHRAARDVSERQPEQRRLSSSTSFANAASSPRRSASTSSVSSGRPSTAGA